ncbi:MAG: SDR family oxidoreductase [Phycisphaerae bacterium]|nr:SDR family oxidoreductase [Phycisphaerae bacterium]
MERQSESVSADGAAPTERRRVLITGCSSGFGLLTAVEAARSGFEVIATLRDPARGDALRQALDAGGLDATIDTLDVTDPESIRRIAARYEPIDVLVNNAGILINGSFADLSEREVRDMFETNCFGAMALTRAVVGPMIQRRRGRIINVASLAGSVGYPYCSAYAASKAALIAFSQSIRVELAPFGIDVVSVEPGFHKTKLIGVAGRMAERFDDPNSPWAEYNRSYLQALDGDVLRWAGSPEKAAGRIVRLMSVRRPKARYIVGADARLAMLCRWLGLAGLMERLFIYRIERARRLRSLGL